MHGFECKRRWAGGVAVAAVVWSGLIGQASAESLTDALAAAYSSNPTLLAERARLRALDETVPQASAGWKPTIALSGSYGTQDGVSKSAALGLKTDIDTDPVTGAATITQPVFSGGRTLFNVLQSKASVRAGRARLFASEQQVLLSAVSAYFDVIRDEATVDLSRNNVTVLERQLQAARDRFEVGEITRTDVAQAEARLSRAQSTLIGAEAQLTSSRSAYERIIGTPPASLDRDVPPPVLPQSEAEALDMALRFNPTLLAARETERASRHAVRSASGRLLPTVSVQGQFGHSEDSSITGTQSDVTTVTGQVSVPIYQAGAEYAGVRQAKHTNSQNRLEISAAQRQVEEGVSNAWEGLVSARATIGSNREQVRAAEIALEGVRQEAEVGSRTTLDVLNAEQELLDAQVALVRSQRDEFVASYNLLSASGRLSAQDLGLPVEIYDPKDNARSLIWKQFWLGAGE